jgi:hypothetical protein
MECGIVTYSDVLREAAEILDLQCAAGAVRDTTTTHLRDLADLLDTARIGSGDLMAIVKQLISPLSDP